MGQVTPAEGALAQPALFQQGKGLVHALVPRLAKALLVELVALEQVAHGQRDEVEHQHEQRLVLEGQQNAVAAALLALEGVVPHGTGAGSADVVALCRGTEHVFVTCVVGTPAQVHILKVGKEVFVKGADLVQNALAVQRGLAKLYPEMNFIGVDIKGARMWTGAKKAIEEGQKNVAFLRTNIEIIDRFFAADEVQEIWLTFSDPQMKNPRKRLTSTYFMNRYRHFLVDGGIIHLKTDSNFLFTYTTYMVDGNHLPVLFRTEDLYHQEGIDEETRKILSIQTYYESMWIERGLNIKYQKFALPREGELVEPDIEIPLDDYRSYRRDKRSSKDTAK